MRTTIQSFLNKKRVKRNEHTVFLVGEAYKAEENDFGLIFPSPRVFRAGEKSTDATLG